MHTGGASKPTKQRRTDYTQSTDILRSEERRGGKECRTRGSPYH